MTQRTSPAIVALLVLACGDDGAATATSNGPSPTGVQPVTSTDDTADETPTTSAAAATSAGADTSTGADTSSGAGTSDTGSGVCTPGSTRCVGQQVEVCDGEGWQQDHPCDPLLGLVCDAGFGECVGACASLGGLSYIGCDYYPLTTQQADIFMSDFNPFAVAVANAAGTNAMVAVHRGDELIAQVTVPADSVKIIKLPWVPALTAGSGPTKHAKQSAYHLRSNQPVTVYQFNPLNADTSNDASLLLPVNTWTGNYLIAAWPHWADYNYPGFYTVTASRDNTIVKVKGPPGGTAVAAGGGIDATGTGMALLNTGDVLTVVTANGGDVTGSIVSADKPVQVIAGHECTQIPFGVPACDHLEETIFPVEVLSEEYVVVPPVQVPNNAAEKAMFVRIVAAADDTLVEFEPDQGVDGVLASAGEFIELATTTAKFKVTADHKILVAQFMVGQDGGFGTSDPAMLLAVPSAQYRDNYLVYAQSAWKANFVDIIAPTGASVSVDGVAVPGLAPIGQTGFSLAHVKLTNTGDGNHTLTGDQKFGISVYGVVDYGSYWYPGGLDLSWIPPG